MNRCESNDFFSDDRGQEEVSDFLWFKEEKSKQEREAGLNLNKLNNTRDWQYLFAMTRFR